MHKIAWVDLQYSENILSHLLPNSHRIFLYVYDLCVPAFEM